MPLTSPVFNDVTTINYTLEWPHLENASNTTFAGPTQIDICKCGPKNLDIGHIYTRYRCPRPKVHFTSPDSELWVLQAPLGQVNLLRPANNDEIQRRSEINDTADPKAYTGKNFLLLTGPCPRGRYQAYATLQFLRSLSPQARQSVEYLSLLIQPYEEDCSDDQGGRAYIELARYILEEVPSFKSLYLNIWGEETRIGSREFAMLLWREGVTIVTSWDWCGRVGEEYTEIGAFLRAVETGVVVRRPVGVDRGGREVGEENYAEFERRVEWEDAVARHQREKELSGSRGLEKSNVNWKEVSGNDEIEDDSSTSDEGDGSDHDENNDGNDSDEGGVTLDEGSVDDEEAATTPIGGTASSEEDWSDALMTPLSPPDGTEESEWQVL